jgi:hypothetical protein
MLPNDIDEAPRAQAVSSHTPAILRRAAP